MSRQLSIVDLIQQYLTTRRWHHLSRILFCTLKIPAQIRIWTQHETKHDSHMLSPSQLLISMSKGSTGLKNMCQERWFHNQQWNKGLDMIPNRNNMRIITLTHLEWWSATPSVELLTGRVETNKQESLNWHFSIAKWFPNTNGYLDHLWPQIRHPCGATA